MYVRTLIFIIGCFICNRFSFSFESPEENPLYIYGKVPEYSGDALRTLKFPIGGIGTGNITLGGRGNIQELEIFNRPAKMKTPDLTFFSIWVREEGGLPRVKLLEREHLPPYEGWMGYPRHQLAGLPRFQEVIFRGEYPFAYLDFMDDEIPCHISLEAYNPFIPLSPDESGIPCAVFYWKIENTCDHKIEFSIAMNMMNPIVSRQGENLSLGGNCNQFIQTGTHKGLYFTSNRTVKTDLEWGSIAIGTTSEIVETQTRWYRGGWWDNAHIFWDDFSDDGHIREIRDVEDSKPGKSDVGTLLVRYELDPHTSCTVPFYLSWYFPNRENYWNREEEVRNRRFQNYYADQFTDAWDVIRFTVQNENRLKTYTQYFHDILFQSSYPVYVLDAISSQMSTLKTNVVIRDNAGNFYGWEGLAEDEGCCMGSCTHVWNYEQTLAYLYPSLERKMREIAFLNDTFENGYQTFRTLFPPGNYWWKVHPATDGQMGNIIRVYREWKYSGNTEWLRLLWPRVKAALEFSWKGVDAEAPEWQQRGCIMPWDRDKNGVMEGQQHNTYDIDFYGPNTMVGALYLGALKAASEMAIALNEPERAREYRKVYELGSRKYDELLWNGEYYFQKVIVADGLKIPDHLVSPEGISAEQSCECRQPPAGNKSSMESMDVMPKYQYGEGCLSDQLLGQYLAHLTGLGYLMNPKHVDMATKAIFANNFKPRFKEFSNVQRVYALNDESGLLLCTWPRGNRPSLPFVYSDEVWTGIEYQVASSLIYSGYLDEGLTIVKAVRERHRGFNRNPWDEFECGHHYARAMSSWALLVALSGFQYDGIDKKIVFNPQLNKSDFSSFWSSGSGWGKFSIRQKKAAIRLAYGLLDIKRFGMGKDCGYKSVKYALLNNQSVLFLVKKDKKNLIIQFQNNVHLDENDMLEIQYE